MPKISVVLATFNEAKNIVRCLESVESFADEIIVVDGSSSDSTVELAKKFGAKILQTTNKQNFHINKQMAIDAASAPIVLQMDADERVDLSLKDFILQLSNKLEMSSDISSFQPKAWYIQRKNHFLGRWLRKGGQYPDPVIRLFINGYARLPQQDVHEQMKVDGEIATASGHIMHYPNPTFSDYLLNSFNRYTSFTAQKLFESKLKISLFASINFLVWKPLSTFVSIYFRHKGFVDGLPGFIFALFSGLHHVVAYLKLWELTQIQKKLESS